MAIQAKNELESAILSTQGLKGLKNRALNSSISYFKDKMKRHFGIEMDFDQNQYDIVVNWIKQRDQRFKDHISNPYVINNTKKDISPIIDGNFILKLDKATYVHVYGNIGIDENNNTKVRTLHLYIFGKHTFKYFKSLSKFIETEKKIKIIFFIM